MNAARDFLLRAHADHRAKVLAVARQMRAAAGLPDDARLAGTLLLTERAA